MRRASFCLLLVGLPALAGCHGLLGGRTTQADKDLNSFAQARERAATFYDGKDYYRAAAQYKKALDLRKDHLPTRLGYAYSLMYTNLPTNLMLAKQEFEGIGKLRDEKDEVKRIYGLALTYRTLAVLYYRRAGIQRDAGRLKPAEEDESAARSYARDGIRDFEKVLAIDDLLASRQISSVARVSASLKPDAHIGIAHCEIVLGGRDSPEHIERAIGHIREYAKMASTARRFWEQKREALLVTDPMREAEQGWAGKGVLDDAQRQRYEERIARTIIEEVAVRRALVDTYLFLDRYVDAVDECNTILSLDASESEALYLRARAYELLAPPNYRMALADMEAYRNRQDLGQLTEKLVRINRQIQRYKKLVAEQEARATPAGGS